MYIVIIDLRCINIISTSASCLFNRFIVSFDVQVLKFVKTQLFYFKLPLFLPIVPWLACPQNLRGTLEDSQILSPSVFITPVFIASVLSNSHKKVPILCRPWFLFRKIIGVVFLYNPKGKFYVMS